MSDRPYGDRLRYGLEDALLGALLNPHPCTPANLLRGLGYLLGRRGGERLRDVDVESVEAFARYMEEEIVIVGSVGVWTGAPFCRCERPNPDPALGLACSKCSLPVECDFADPDHPHAAVVRHIDYLVCRDHLDAAVENVHARTM